MDKKVGNNESNTKYMKGNTKGSTKLNESNTKYIKGGGKTSGGTGLNEQNSKYC